MKSALGRLSALLDELISTADGDANRGTARGAVDGNAAHTIARGAVDGDIARNITRSSPEYIRCVMECLILAGLSMQLCGNSRPASGAEHTCRISGR